MSSLYAATEFGPDLQTLAYLGHHTVDKARLRSFKKTLGLEVPRVGRWVLRAALKHGLGRAELTGWILAGDQKPEPAGLPTLLSPTSPVGPDALPSAHYGGLLRLGQSPNGAYWAAELHHKAMPVYLLDPHPDAVRAGWRKRFDRLDDFVFFAAKAALCQRDRISVEEFLELARERGVRPEELVPDSLEDERESLGRLGLRRPKKMPTLVANRFLWADLLLTSLPRRKPSIEEVARLWTDTLGLHRLREENDDLSNVSVQAFWLFRHALFGDQAGYHRILNKVQKPWSILIRDADAEARRWWDATQAPFDRTALAKALEPKKKAR